MAPCPRSNMIRLVVADIASAETQQRDTVGVDLAQQGAASMAQPVRSSGASAPARRSAA